MPRSVADSSGCSRVLDADGAAATSGQVTSYRFHPCSPRAGEIVSHGDLGPWNTVYRHAIPVAFIDWDAAQPVEPLADLAAAAWTFVPLAPPGHLAEAGFEPLPDLAARNRAEVDRIAALLGVTPAGQTSAGGHYTAATTATPDHVELHGIATARPSCPRWSTACWTSPKH
jgi:hypothetical protein